MDNINLLIEEFNDKLNELRLSLDVEAYNQVLLNCGLQDLDDYDD